MILPPQDAPKGKTPVIRLVAKKSRASMISRVTNKGREHKVIYSHGKYFFKVGRII